MPAPTTTTSHSPIVPHKKFGTFAGLGQIANRSGTTSAASGGSGSTRPSVKGLFDEPGFAAGGGLGSNAGSPRLGLTGLAPPHSGRDGLAPGNIGSSVEGPWSISVAEAQDKDKREGRKRKHAQAVYTLYVTTPTHNLTLTRSAAEIIELDQKIREGQSQSTSLPSLPQLPSSPPQTSGRRILKTLSRTLSPSGNRSRGGLVNPLALDTPTSPTSLPAEASKLGSPTPPSAPLSPTIDEAHLSAHSTTTQLATYFTSISNLPFIRRHKAWKRFARVGSDDLQSVRVERRVRKVRSDLAQHVKSSVAPTNTNVGVSPSHSDLGEDDGRTEDETEDAASTRENAPAASGQSENEQLPEVPDRSTSVDQDRASTIEDKSMSSVYEGKTESHRKSVSGIPEENISQDTETTAESSRNRPVRRSTRRRNRDGEKVTVDDFDMIRVLGKGCAGKVLLVRHQPTKGLYAMKSIHKRHVLAHQELQHTLTEQSVLKRMMKEEIHPFVVRLWWSFHDRNYLYLVMDFHPGGDLATQLSRWGRLGRDRARFYAAEIVEGLEGLHKAGVIYRDLKPENVLIGADGHIVLSDFGLSKEFTGPRTNGTSTPPPNSPGRSHSSNNVSAQARSAHWLSASEDSSGRSSNRFLDDRETTNTFCGTAEYLAPEVIQGNSYSYEVDWWSFGTMLYEMLTGITPFWADTHADMYVRVLKDELVFPEDRVLDQDTRSIIRGLLQRNPMLRMKEPRIKKHPYFSMIEWDHIYHKRYIPPYIPPIDPQNEIDTQNFDETFLEMQPTATHAPEEVNGGGADGSAKAEEAANGGEESVDTSKRVEDLENLFDGYSFRGRRDSESIRSSIISSGPGESIVSEETTNAASSNNPTDAPRPAPPAKVERQVDEDEDDEAAARAAVAALEHLESEANADAALGHSSVNASESTQAASSAPSREATSNGTSDSEHSQTSNSIGSPASSYVAGKSVGKPSLSAGGQPANASIRELDDEDDDWDMIETDGALKSEVNGGKGTNLFARGVVDTYRLLRRQESSRLPPSASYGSTSSRPFNRLGKRRTMVGGTGLGKPSSSTLTSASAQSLDTDQTNPDTSGEQQSLSPPKDDVRRSIASTGSDDTKHQARMKKIKRFTTFFEPASHR